MAFLLGCEKVQVEFPSKVVLDGVSLGVDVGDRIGIVEVTALGCGLDVVGHRVGVTRRACRACRWRHLRP